MPDTTGGPPGENSTIRYEEILDIRDDEGAGSLVGWARIAIAFVIVSSLVSVVLVAAVVTRGLATQVGGMGVLREFAGELVADQPLVIGVFVLAGLLFVLVGVAFVWLLVRNQNRALDKEVHVRVTDDGVSVERKGSQYWQSPGVDVPFDAITAVEYVDPAESSFRVELGDLRAPKFFAGRSQDWIRLERSRGPAIYVGSDRPRELAETIARRVPGNVTARPY